VNRSSIFAVVAGAVTVALVGYDAAGCTSTLDLGHDDPPPLSWVSADGGLVVPQGAEATLTVTAGGSPDEAATFGCSVVVPGVSPPAGVACKTSALDGGTFQVTITATADAAPGGYPALVQSTHGSVTRSAQLEYVVGPHVVVSAATDLDAGIDGSLDQTMSTGLQPAEWQIGLFAMPNVPEAIRALQPAYVLIQLLDFGAIPLVTYKAEDAGRSASDWDFSKLDDVVGNVIRLGLHPVLQIGVQPSITSPPLDPLGKPTPLLAEYAKALVGYYNHGSFAWGNDTVTNDAGTANAIQWWSILTDFNAMEPIYSAQQYTYTYETVVNAMEQQPSVVPLSISGFEFSDQPTGSTYSVGPTLATFLAGSDGGGLAAPLDAVTLHFFGAYGSDAFDTTDSQIFDQTRQFVVNDFAAVRRQTGPETQVWVTENNVQSAVPDHNGDFSTMRGRPFQNDTRGTSTFFAAWRPYLFSMLGRAGNQGLFQWQFTDGYCRPPNDDTKYCATPDGGGQLDLDPQGAEVKFDDGTPFLSYWVDYWLGRLFAPPQHILRLATWTDSDDVEALATQTDQGAVIMVVDHAVDPDPMRLKNGGLPRTVVVDLPPGLAGKSAEQLVLDHDPQVPVSAADTMFQPVAVSTRWVVPFVGYGVAFLRLAN
jgi:hypothetical protein